MVPARTGKLRCCGGCAGGQGNRTRGQQRVQPPGPDDDAPLRKALLSLVCAPGREGSRAGGRGTERGETGGRGVGKGRWRGWELGRGDT